MRVKVTDWKDPGTDKKSLINQDTSGSWILTLAIGSGIHWIQDDEVDQWLNELIFKTSMVVKYND